MEKFALLNLLKALETLSPPKPEGTAAEENEKKTEAAQNPAPRSQTPENAVPNVMASVLSRHEQISNRIKNSRR